MTSFELGYIVGCFESEGHTSISEHGQIVNIVQNDKRMLTYINNILPNWKLYGPYKNVVGNDHYHLQLNRLREVKEFLDFIRPYLIVKAFQVDDVLSHLNYRLRRRGFPATEPGEELFEGMGRTRLLF